MEQHKSVIWIVTFLMLTVFPSCIYFFLGKYVDLENYENRNMTSRPELTLEDLESYPEEYETYYNDNLPFRNQLIRFHNSIDYFVFEQSSSENVTIGKDGWLFFSESSSNPIEQSLGYWHFTSEELQTIADNLMAVKSVLDSQGIEFVLFIAPNKESIYMDELPDYYAVKSNYTSTDQLVEYLRENTDLRVIYPKQELLAAREDNPDVFLYHKLDTHWNYAGGYVGVKCLAEELGIEMKPLGGLLLEPVVSSNGDLTNMLNVHIKDGDIDYQVSGISALNTVNDEWDFWGEFVYHTDGADPRKLFVRRDSYSSAMAPSLATQFENSLWVHEDSFDGQKVFDWGADIFVLEVVERYEKNLQEFRLADIASAQEGDEGEDKELY